MQKNKPATVDEYINAAPKEAQEKLHEMRAILKEVAPLPKVLIRKIATFRAREVREKDVRWMLLPKSYERILK